MGCSIYVYMSSSKISLSNRVSVCVFVCVSNGCHSWLCIVTVVVGVGFAVCVAAAVAFAVAVAVVVDDAVVAVVVVVVVVVGCCCCCFVCLLLLWWWRWWWRWWWWLCWWRRGWWWWWWRRWRWRLWLLISRCYTLALSLALFLAHGHTQRTACAQRSIVWALQEFIVWRIGQQSRQVVREPEHHVSARRCAKDLLRDRSILTSHWLQYFARKEPPSGSVADACRDRQGWISQR